MNKPSLSEDRLRSLINSRSLLRLVRGVIALSIVTAMLNATVLAAASSRRTPDLSTGTVTVRGTVEINGQSAISGQTLFSSSHIVTSADSESLISFTSSARLNLGAATDLTVQSSPTGISGSLNEGQVFGLLPAGVLFDLKSLDASIVTDAREPVVFHD